MSLILFTTSVYCLFFVQSSCSFVSPTGTILRWILLLSYTWLLTSPLWKTFHSVIRKKVDIYQIQNIGWRTKSPGRDKVQYGSDVVTHHPFLLRTVNSETPSFTTLTGGGRSQVTDTVLTKIVCWNFNYLYK